LGEFWESEVDLTELETEIRKTLGYETDEEGEIVTSQIVSDFFKNLGYDSIIIDNVSKRFNFMSGVSNTTSHIHIFDDFSNQIKLADDTNVTYNIESRDIRFQIVGESAILESTIRDNLDVAMTMENSGKTETQIKQSTGWERGSEGKWRYEITDLTESQWGKISEYVLNNAGRRDDIDELTRIAKDGYNKNLLEEGGLASDFEYMIGKYVQIKFKDKLKLTLSDLSPMFDNVIKVYPELAGMEVKKSSTVTMATYTPSENSIKINIDGILYDQKNPYYHLATSLHHEVQHKIQDIEGFEQGASPQMRTPKARKAINEIIENTESLRAANPLISNRDEPLEALNDFYEYAKSEYFSSTPIEERRKIGTLSEGIKNFLSVDYKGSINKVNLLLDSIAKFEDTQSKLGFENYLKVAGEVEARNVQRRMALNQNQRIDIALKDTEDVYRDNQISYSDVSGYTELEVGSKLGSFYNTRENIENTSSIFDSRLELLDLYSSKEEVDINEQLDCG
jgi:subtilisin-like proprotein convertase family protein